MNILQLVNDRLTSNAVNQISKFLDEDPQSITSGLSAGLPAIVAGFMQKASTVEGAADLLSLLKRDKRYGGFSDDISGSLKGGLGPGLISAGSGLLSMLFGEKSKGLVRLVGNISGLKVDASSLLHLATPLVMGVLSQKVQSDEISVAGLTALLMSQKDAVKAVLPAGIDHIVNVHALGSFVKGSEAEPVLADDETRGGFPGLLPWLLLGLLILGGLYFWKSCQNKASGVTPGTDSVATVIISDDAEPVIQKRLSTGVNLRFREFSIENELISFIENDDKPVDKETWFNFRKLTFEQGSTAVDSTSEIEVDNLAEILKAFPEVSLRIGGYTDNTGSAEVNTRLSAERAENVVSALVKRGISVARLTSEGYGPLHPLADNATEKGRHENRRIAVRVTRK